jgi:hypothetical protein
VPFLESGGLVNIAQLACQYFAAIHSLLYNEEAESKNGTWEKLFEAADRQESSSDNHISCMLRGVLENLCDNPHCV